MGTSIDDFKSTVMKHDSLALPNRFNVIFTPPKMSLLNLNIGNLMANAVTGGLKARNFINDISFGLNCDVHKNKHKHICGIYNIRWFEIEK